MMFVRFDVAVLFCDSNLVSLLRRNSPTFKSFEDKMGNLKVSRGLEMDRQPVAKFSVWRKRIKDEHLVQISAGRAKVKG